MGASKNSLIIASAVCCVGLFLVVAPVAKAESGEAKTAGARTPFTTIEAEAGTLEDGAVLKRFQPPVPKVATLEVEASGDAYVTLEKTGASVSWKNPVAEANALVIRNSIPDTARGGGMTATVGLYIDGKFRQNITLSSKQSWSYRTRKGPVQGWLDDPSYGGMPFHFYHDDRARVIGQPIPAGSTITLRKDSNSASPVYHIDLIDVEHVAPPLTRPASSLSVVDFGADPKGEIDSQEAIRKCADAARKEGKIVWIPAGHYKVSSLKSGALTFEGITVQGAGMWYTTLYRAVPNPFLAKVSYWRSIIGVRGKTVLRDLRIDSNSIVRGIGKPGGGDYGIASSGDGWLVERVWVQHCDAQWMSGSNGVIRDCRVSDSWGDGINLNNSNMPRPDANGVNTAAGINLAAINNYVRGNGDDGIATYSDGGKDGKNPQMVGTRIIGNTSVAPFWANALRVAGGKNVVVRNNLCSGSSSNSAMTVGVFGKSGNPLVSALIENNVIIGGGGWNVPDRRHGLVIGSVYQDIILRNNLVKNSRRSGIYLSGKVEVTLENNTIVAPADSGVLIGEKAEGTGIFKGNSFEMLQPGEKEVVNKAPDKFKIQ